MLVIPLIQRRVLLPHGFTSRFPILQHTVSTGNICPSLVRDLVLVILDHVVGLAAPAEVALADDLHHVVGGLALAGAWGEAGAQLFDGVAAETRQPRVQHQRHQRHDRLSVRPGTNEREVILASGV